MTLSNNELEARFGNPWASRIGENVAETDIRNEFKEFAEWLDERLPEGRHKSLALTELEAAFMWSFKAAVATTGQDEA